MLQVSDAIKAAYKSDSTPKRLTIAFFRKGESVAFLTIRDSTHIMSESMEISEALSSDENIEFGSCEATQLKITLVDVEEDLKDSIMSVTQLVDEQYAIQIGMYIVQSADKQANRRYRDVVALDFMSRFDVNVIDWYNSLSFPMSLKSFRANLCAYIGVAENVPDNLRNDNMVVEKTVDAAELIGRDVLIAIEQANGAFGHFDRNGILKHITLERISCIYPAEDLYPSEDLYPIKEGGTSNETIESYLMLSCVFEEYTVKTIDKVQIKQEEGDIGAIYGDGTNAYTLTGNFLMYGKTSEELTVIAQNIYGMISGVTYIPYESETKGLPYVEVGDVLRLDFGERYILSYMMKRTMKGIYALRDSYSATGEEIRSVENNVNAEIIQLKGKAAFLTKSVDEVSAKLIDVEQGMEAQFTVTAEQISAEVKRALNTEVELAAAIKINADNIALKVSKGEVSAQISIESGGVDIKGNRFSWTSTNSSLTADGTLACKNGTFSGKVTATTGKIGGFTLAGSKLTASSDAKIDFNNFYLDTSGLFFEGVEIDEDGIYIGSIGNRFTHMWETDTGDLYCNELYIDQSWWEGWSVTETVQELWEYVHGGGWNPCGSDCDDDCNCDSESCSCNGSDGECGCESETLIDDIDGCGGGCDCDGDGGSCSCDSESPVECGCDGDCSSYNEGPGC